MKSESGFLMLLSVTMVTAVVCAHTSVSPPSSNLQEFFQRLIDLSRNETRRLEDYVSVLEQKLNDINVALDLKINKSEQEISKLRNELQQEKSIRSGLQRQTDNLTMQLFDMAAKYTSMVARMNAFEAHTNVLNGSVSNLTKTVSGVDVTKLEDDHVQLLELKQKQGIVIQIDHGVDGRLNPFKSNGFCHHYQLDQSISVLRVDGWYFLIFIQVMIHVEQFSFSR